MEKMKNKKTNWIIGILALVSLVISVGEGFFYYGADDFPHPLFRGLLIFQNSIKAYGFQTEIDLKDVAEQMAASSGALETFFGYAYTVVIFIAPSCTIAVVYKMVEHLLRIEFFQRLFSKKKRMIIIGYNEAVKTLLSEKQADYRIHLVSPDVPKEEDAAFFKDGVIVHHADCLKLENRKRESLFGWMELNKAKEIVLFEDSSARNFALYQMLHEKSLWDMAQDDLKIFCRCEDEGIRQIIEDYHDSRVNTEGAWDLELVSVPELRVRKMLEAPSPSLHAYYENSGKAPKDWKLHMLIIGFGKLGQQLLLQAMNLGVVSSENDILIDVVDFDMQNKKSIFANNFNEEYVEDHDAEDEFVIPSSKADGELRIRFHSMDIRHKQFYKQLCENGDPKTGDGVFTYIAICIEDMDVGLHCMTEVKRYLQKYEGITENVSIGIRMEANSRMSDYLNSNQDTYKNVFVIEEAESAIRLDNLIHDSLTQKAKKFNKVYNEMNMQSLAEFLEEEKKQKEQNTGAEQKKEPQDENSYWRTLKLFRRKSNLAVAQHGSVKKELFTEGTLKELQKFLETCRMTYQKDKNVWIYECSEDELVKYQSDRTQFPNISEMSRMEHRRWCYFMASIGWKRTKNDSEEAKYGRKEPKYKVNPCLCTWDDLVKYKKEYCKYDLMPLLVEYMEK